MSMPTADAHDTPATIEDITAPITDAEQVAIEVRVKLDARHQSPEDIRAGAHARWPDHTLTIDETVDAALAGEDVVVVHEEESGHDAFVDTELTGLEADEDGVIDPEEISSAQRPG